MIDIFEIYSANKSTLKETSAYNNGFMTESNIEALNFDNVKNEYVAQILKNAQFKCEGIESNDALVKVNDEYIFIEFKNGNMQNCLKEVRPKLYDSLFIFLDIIKETISFSRRKIIYILVYNEKNSEDFINARKNNQKQMSASEIQDSKSFDYISNAIGQLANYEMDIFDLRKKFQSFLFKEVHTFTATQFDDYINKIYK